MKTKINWISLFNLKSKVFKMILQGITTLELAGLAPSQFCGKVLRDMGAKVIRVDKTGYLLPQEDILSHGKLSVSLDLKKPQGIKILKKLCTKVDILVEPYRPGVMEKLGLGPDQLLNVNKRLIYVRISGFGQTGLYSKIPGHDINFLALSGVLSLFEKRNKAPAPPCNILGDFASGSIMSVLGIVSALYEREKSGKGQVVDVSMMRSSSYLASWIMDSKNLLWNEPPGCNPLDGGTYVYNVYKTKDGKWMAVGALEKKFYDNTLIALGLTEEECPQFCENGYEIFSKKFLEKTQKEWTEIFQSLDSCVTPVLSVNEAINERPEDFIKSCGPEKYIHPVPEPRFSRTMRNPSSTEPSPVLGQHTVSLLMDIGYSPDQIKQLASDKVVQFPKDSKL